VKRTLFPLFALLALFSTTFAVPGWAVIITAGDGTANTTAPNDDPGFANVGTIGGSSVVYLGDSWCITARHAIPDNFNGTIDFGGRDFHFVPGSNADVPNPSGFSLTQFSDLFMFRLVEDPNLPTLSIAHDTSSAGTFVAMIGAGNSREARHTFFDQTPTPGSAAVTWTETNLGKADAIGYKLTGEKTMRWGYNFVSNGTNRVVSSFENRDVLALTTTFFGSPPFAFDAQATNGDSGGALFTKFRGGWRLSGIINSEQKFPNQPDNTVMFGNQTYSADLSQYWFQIQTIMGTTTASSAASSAPALSTLTNLLNPSDVNGDAAITAYDALVLIDRLNAVGAGPLSGLDADGMYYDVNGDGMFSAADALAVINSLNLGETVQVAHGTAVPEPSSCALAIVALAGMTLFGLRRKLNRGQ